MGSCFFSLLPFLPQSSICDILCYVVSLLSIAEKELEYVGQEMDQLGCPQEKSLRAWSPQA